MWSLLYVGVAPRAPGTRTLADRVGRDHTTGNIGGSTFRQSLAALLVDSLALKPKLGSDRSRLVSEGPLQQWIDRNCGVTFARHPSPWTCEAEVILALRPPLNIDQSAHPFSAKVSARRSALRRACGL